MISPAFFISLSIKIILVNSFYIFLVVAILLGGLLGYLAGFSRIIFLFIKITGAVVVGYLLYPAVADLLNTNIESITEYANAIAFFTIVGFAFILLHLFFMPLTKRLTAFNKTKWNKAGGIVAGLHTSVIAVLLVSQFTTLISVPLTIEDEIKSRGIAEIINQPVEFINDKFIPIFQEQQVKVMALKAVDSTPEAGINLSYTTNDFELRPDLASQMLQLVNAERNKQGLKSLSADPELTVAAKAHSADMFTRGYFSHNTPEGITPFQRLHKLHITYLFAGENLAMAPGLIKAHDGLMRSPGHRANILNPSYGRIGIAVLDAGVHGLMITQEFRN